MREIVSTYICMMNMLRGSDDISDSSLFFCYLIFEKNSNFFEFFRAFLFSKPRRALEGKTHLFHQLISFNQPISPDDQQQT